MAGETVTVREEMTMDGGTHVHVASEHFARDVAPMLPLLEWRIRRAKRLVAKYEARHQAAVAIAKRVDNDSSTTP